MLSWLFGKKKKNEIPLEKISPSIFPEKAIPKVEIEKVIPNKVEEIPPVKNQEEEKPSPQEEPLSEFDQFFVLVREQYTLPEVSYLLKKAGARHSAGSWKKMKDRVRIAVEEEKINMEKIKEKIKKEQEEEEEEIPDAWRISWEVSDYFEDLLKRYDIIKDSLSDKDDPAVDNYKYLTSQRNYYGEFIKDLLEEESLEDNYKPLCSYVKRKIKSIPNLNLEKLREDIEKMLTE